MHAVASHVPVLVVESVSETRQQKREKKKNRGMTT